MVFSEKAGYTMRTSKISLLIFIMHKEEEIQCNQNGIQKKCKNCSPQKEKLKSSFILLSHFAVYILNENYYNTI